MSQLFYLSASEGRAQEASGYSIAFASPEWIWKQISMDFIMGLSRTKKGNDSIWIIMDRLTKSAYFLSVKTNYTVDILGKIYTQEIVRLHGISVSILFDRGSSFTSTFWKILQKALVTQLDFSSAY